MSYQDIKVGQNHSTFTDPEQKYIAVISHF